MLPVSFLALLHGGQLAQGPMALLTVLGLGAFVLVIAGVVSRLQQ